MTLQASATDRVQTAQSIEVNTPAGGFKVDTGSDGLDIIVTAGLIALGVTIWLILRKK